MLNELIGKNYIVTGASSGIGRAVCIELGKQGANVIMVARNEERLKNTASKMSEGNHTQVIFDLADVDGIEEIVGNVYAKYGSIDGMVYCAGTGSGFSLQKTTPAVIHGVFLVNFYAFIELTRCVIKKKKKEHPMRIAAISSIASLTNIKNYTDYSSSKAALEAAVRVLATELSKKNTTINTIRPAYVDTEMTASMKDIFEDFEGHIKSTGFQPLGLIDPVDVAKLAAYLLSDAAKSITGMAIPINGGARF